MSDFECVCCRDGGIDPEAIDARTQAHIDEFGWSVIAVSGREPFAYTVGLTEKSLPELYTTVPIEMALRSAQRNLNAAGTLVVDGANLLTPFDLRGTRWLGTSMTDHTPLVLARRRYGRIRSVQIARVKS